ncbi:MAG: T9SS type A sorting domain-containing protein [candidate division WOR-3 bacterium]
MKHLLIISIIIIITLGFGANIIRAPKIEAVGIKETFLSVRPPVPKSLTSLDQHIIDIIPDLRSTAGTAGKNIVLAEDGHSVAVIYGRESGDPDNIMVICIAYSTDLGSTWLYYGSLSPMVRRAYSAIDAEDDFATTGLVHFAWHEATRISGSYDSSPCFYIRETSYPDGTFYPFRFRLPNSGRRDVWTPCIGVRDSVVVITAMNNGTYVITYDCYIWRSTDYGVTWDSGRVFLPFPQVDYAPHFRFGSDGYIFFLWCKEDSGGYWPYYCESYNYGLTWTPPQLLWGNNPPYPNMSGVTCWGEYDCEVVRDTPVVVVNLSSDNSSYGETWVYYPVPESGGGWQFIGKKLVGGDSTAPQRYSRFPTIAADDYGNIFIGYQKIFETPNDTGPDCGMFIRYAGKDTWYDYGRITFNAGALEERDLEFAHNAPVIAGGDSTLVGMIYHNAGTYPTSGNLYFDYVVVPSFPGIQESQQKSTIEQIKVYPNPFRNSVRFILPAQIGEAKILIYDVTGRLVTSHPIRVSREGRFDQPQATSHCFIWDGSKASPGVYFYKVESPNGKYQGKIILTR